MKWKMPKNEPINKDAEDWRGALAKILSKYNKFHADGKKHVSFRTSEARAFCLFRWFFVLRLMGFRVAPQGLGERHIVWLMRYWTCDPRVAELPADRAEKIVPLTAPLSAAYIQQQLSILRVFAGWIGKKGMVRSASDYVDNPSLVARTYAAQYDHSWSAALPSIQELIDKVSKRNPWVGIQLELMLAFGLRRKEAVMFLPHIQEMHASEIPLSHRSSYNYLVFVRIKRGTKGGRLRFTPVRDAFQKATLERARQFARYDISHLSKPGLKLKQSLAMFSNTVVACGITKAMLGITPHGLRHQFANDLFVELTDIPSPIRGGTGIDPKAMREAYLEIARQLGHNRPRITSAYVGSSVSTRKQVNDANPDGDEDRADMNSDEPADGCDGVQPIQKSDE